VQLFGYTLFKPTFVNGSASAGLTSFCCFDQFLLDWPVWLAYPFAGLPIYWFLHLLVFALLGDHSKGFSGILALKGLSGSRARNLRFLHKREDYR
jgi:hypothetical protein